MKTVFSGAITSFFLCTFVTAMQYPLVPDVELFLKRYPEGHCYVKIKYGRARPIKVLVRTNAELARVHALYAQLPADTTGAITYPPCVMKIGLKK